MVDVMWTGEDPGAGDGARSAAPHVSLRALRIACGALAVLGAALPLSALSSAFSASLEAGSGAPVDRRTTMLMLGITGGSHAGRWLAQLALVAHLERAERWAWRASLAGVGAALLVDVVYWLGHGVAWSVVLLDAVPGVLVGGLLLGLGRRATRELPPPPPPRAPQQRAPQQRAVLFVCAVGLLSGLAIAFGGTSVLFDPWRRGLAAAHYGGTSSAHAEELVAQFFGSIGGATVAQFAVLGLLARGGVGGGERRALDWILASFLGWFLVDSAWSLAAGGAFNVLLVNLPFAVLALPVLAWARVRAAPRAT